MRKYGKSEFLQFAHFGTVTFNFTNFKFTGFFVPTKRKRKEKISSNQHFSNFFGKTITFTKFLQKKCEREFFCNFHTVHSRAGSIFGKNFVKVTVLLNKLQKFDLTKNFFDETEFLVFPQCHNVEIAEILSHTFFAKISWK